MGLNFTRHPQEREGMGGSKPAAPTQNPIPSGCCLSTCQPTRHPWRCAQIPGCQQSWGSALLCLPCSRDRDFWQLPAGKVSGALWEHESELAALPDVSLLLIY